MKKEMMSSRNSNLNEQKYISCTHGSCPINEYNILNLITCMFPMIFPYKTSALEMQHYTIKIPLDSHV
jgi:hypothetical protein